MFPSLTHISRETKPDGSKVETKTTLKAPADSLLASSIAYSNLVDDVEFKAVLSGAQNNTGTKLRFKAMRPFIWAGLACIILGIACCVMRFTSTVIGASIAGMGVGLTSFGAYVPGNEAKVFYGLIALGIFAIGYVLFRHGKKYV